MGAQRPPGDRFGEVVCHLGLAVLKPLGKDVCAVGGLPVPPSSLACTFPCSQAASCQAVTASLAVASKELKELGIFFPPSQNE